MRLDYLFHCRGNLGKIWGKGNNRRKKQLISIPSSGKLPLKPGFIGQLGTLIPLETACVNVWMVGQLREGKQAYRKPTALWSEVASSPWHQETVSGCMPSTHEERVLGGGNYSRIRRDPTLCLEPLPPERCFLPVRASSLLVIQTLGGFHPGLHVYKDLLLGAATLCVQFLAFQLDDSCFHCFLHVRPPWETKDWVQSR